MANKLNGAREDFLDSESWDFLLGNPKWEIAPSVFLDKRKGPQFLVCRHHSGGSNRAYLHVPRHPFGVLPSPKSDQIAPAVVVPRVLKSTKAHKFSHSYQMGELKGQFDGIDTMRVTDKHQFNFQSILASEKESVAIEGRRDTKALLSRWKQEGKVLPHEIGAQILQSAKRQVPNMDLHSKCWKGATFVTLHDAMKLQTSLKGEKGQTVTTRDSESGEEKEIHYHPKWPAYLVSVHTLDKHGSSFPSLPRFQGSALKNKDCRLLWLVTAMLVIIPSLWEETAHAVGHVDKWNGWILDYATRKCFPERRSVGGINPFKQPRRTNADVFASSKLLSQSSSFSCFEYSYGKELVEIFDNLDSVQVIENNFDPTVEVADEKEVVIVIRDPFTIEDEQRVPPTMAIENHGSWELRAVCNTESGSQGHQWKSEMYCRHGGRAFPRWWKATRKDNAFQRISGDTTPSSFWNDWNVCVYVKVKQLAFEQVRDKFLSTIGGQSQAHCREHDTPLIVAPFDSKGNCCCSANDVNHCTKRVCFQCPVNGCASQICIEHHRQIPRDQKHFFPNNTVSTETEEADDDHVDSVNTETEENDHRHDDFTAFNDNDTTALPDDSEHIHLEPFDGIDDIEYERHTHDDVDSIDNGLEEDVYFNQDNYITDFIQADCDNNDDSGGDDSSACTMNDNVIPTTVSGPAACDITIKATSTIVPGHVILNNCASLLARRGKKLNGTTRQRNFLQRIVSATPGRCVPLVYPEGMLFPSIFWKDDAIDGSILGALPCGLMTDDRATRHHGIASVKDHLRTRISDPSLLTSTDSRYIFYAFDSMANLGLRGEDSRVILNRGFATLQGEGGIRANGEGEELFDTDMIDSKPVVHRLAAAVAEKQATYFLTHTCNMLDHFGIRCLKRWIDSQELIASECVNHKCDPVEDKDEMAKAVIDSASVILLRNWMETAEIYMAYISESPEQPLGKVEKIWWRHEYQDSAGNLSHIHALIWVANESKHVSMSRIRGSISDLLHPNEIDELVAEGILRKPEDALRVRNLGRYILRHVCSDRCKRRTGPNNGDTRCRVPNTMYESPNPTCHVMKSIEVQHSANALTVLCDAGLFCHDPGDDIFKPAHPALKAHKHFPPACAGEGIISPCNGRLFAATLSSQNLQVCTGYLAARYLAKYVAGIDEHNRVHIGAAAHRPNSFEIETELLHNTKVTSSAIQEKKRLLEKRSNVHQPRGRAMSLMECIALILGYKQVYTTIKFVHVPSIPLEERPAFDKRPKSFQMRKEGVIPQNQTISAAEDLDECRVIPNHTVRQALRHLPQWRQFSDSELLILRDQILSPLSLDALTAFAVRPPELRFIRHAKNYFRWFVRDAKGAQLNVATANDVLSANLHCNFEQCPWYDGTNCRIKVRREALPEIVRYMTALDNEDFGCTASDFTPRRVPEQLFFRMLTYTESSPTGSRRLNQWHQIQERFIHEGSSDQSESLPVVWFNNIRPTQPARFLIHVLLSMGAFDNELGLFGNGSLREAFARAGLCDLEDLEGSVRQLTKKYILEQLVYLPGGSQQFDRYCVAAHSAFQDVLIHNRIQSSDIPPVLYTSLQKRASEASLAFQKESRMTLCDSILSSLQGAGLTDLPSVEQLLNATVSSPLANSQIPIPRSPLQSLASYNEQQSLFSRIDSTLDQYTSALPYQVKNICVAGGPGNGKSFVLQVAALHAAAQGLNVGMTAWMSERALQLGGRHLHKLFALPVNETASVVRLAELALMKLYQKPKDLVYLKSLDVLCIDELGQIPAEMIAVLDIIMRRIRQSSQFMGGVLIFSTLDALQLLPVKGRPPLLSCHMLTSFTVTQLKESVRASRDALLREIQDLTRILPTHLQPHHLRRFKHLIKTCCTFIPNWEDSRIKNNKLRVFGRKLAAKVAEKRLLNDMQTLHPTMVCSKSIDQESTLEGHWRNASTVTTNKLNSTVKEPDKLFFYPLAVYEITFNKDGCYSQSQLAVLCEEDIPSEAHIQNFLPVKLVVAPEGCKLVPEGLFRREQFVAAGWTVQMVGVTPERPHTLRRHGGLQAKRRQYGLKHRIASTIHATMGQNLQSLVTAVSSLDKNYMYALWQREQVVVLLSRTNFAKDIHFVGSPDETAEALATVLQARSQYTEYICHVLEVLSTDSHETVASHHFPAVDLTNHPYRPVDIEMPTDCSGFVYMLVSLKDNTTCYFGETSNLRRRLREHNQGYGSKQTATTRLRPWALMAFVCGFGGDKQMRRRFETMWRNYRRQFRNNHGGAATPEQMATLAESVIVDLYQQQQSSFENSSFDLCFVKCGKMTM